MKLSLPVVWVVFSLALSGCTQRYLVRPDMLEQVDIWLAEREYGKVLGYIESLPPTHSDYSTLQARLPEIGSMVTSFEKGIVGRAESLTEQKQWADALAEYQRALERNRKRMEKLQRELEPYVIGYHRAKDLGKEAAGTTVKPLFPKKTRRKD